jgi:uncharacterized Zn finger protein
MADEEKKELTCTECGNPIDQGTQLLVRTGCTSREPAHPCSKCGRVHWPDGVAVSNRSGAAAYLEGGAMVMKKDGVEVARF